MKKIRELKIVRGTVRKAWAIHAFFLRSFEKTYPGSILGSVIVTSILLAGALSAGLPAAPGVLCLILTVILVLLAGEILEILVKLLFGRKKRNRVYWLLQFLAVLACAAIGTQLSNVVACLVFSFAMAFLSSLLGRCLWAMLRRRRVTALLLVCLAISTAGLSAIVFFLAGEGSRHTYLDEYLAMAPKRSAEMAKSLSCSAREKGEYEVVALTYGVEDERDIRTTTYDLSAFAEQNFLDKINRKLVLGYGLSDAPLEGMIWYPQGQRECPAVFIVHGNHEYTEDSYLGYGYLGEYLASYGYVVVSVNENACNELSAENDARAVLLLENIKYLLEQNRDEKSLIYQLIDEEKIAIAGHSRGGEAVSEAFLFNAYDSYPENGNIRFSYHFPIRSIIAIAPTVDQYIPAQHEVALKDVNYLIIHGANDQDVTMAMGQKQYGNVAFTGEGDYRKVMLYVSGANHGQFNSTWGKYDSIYPFKIFLNVAGFLEESQQQDILKIFVKTFLDVTLKEDRTDEELLADWQKYAGDLPRTVYQQMYQSSHFSCLADFEEDSDLNTATVPGGRIEGVGLSEWTEEAVVLGTQNTKENYALKIAWEDTREAGIRLRMPGQDITDRKIVFDIADKTEAKGLCLVDGKVTLEDAAGNRASVRISDYMAVYPTLPVQLGKLDPIFGSYEYKNPFQTVTLPDKVFLQENPALDTERIVGITIAFDHEDHGSLWLDNIGLE